jgi:hypothetical protein
VFWVGVSRVPPGLARSLAREAGIGATVVAVDLASLDADLIARLAPRAVLSLLSWSGGDALDVAQRLAAGGFAGPYRALSPALPDRSVIEAEVRSQCPLLDFAVVEIALPQRGAGSL